jgi:hypothetical protein
MELRTGSLDFSLPHAGSGPQTKEKTVVFPRPVRIAVAALSGYTTSYTSGDHNFGRIEIRLEKSILNNTVTVTGTFGLRDWSGIWDDPYNGALDFVVLAELEPATGGSIRTDLAIVDMELNQAIQFFRSYRFLDPATTQPDNAIFMIARKNTGVRVYTDWDSTAGLPTISRLTGTLTVQTGSTTLTLRPINPLESIIPHRDSTTNQALSYDTLNFMIPAAVCVGTITVTCQVFDVDTTSPGSSGAFTRTITFTAVEPLRIFLVGVALTSPPTPAPSEWAVGNSLSRVRDWYPRGDIVQTGFTNITFTEAIDGCLSGSVCHNVLDMLLDLRGGSGDVYFGGLPPVIEEPGHCVGGCSYQDDRIATAFVNSYDAVAHEIGHALGRRHTPCVGCDPPVSDPDPDFPQYGSFPSGSIGVFGFDPSVNRVLNPASSFDFMRNVLGFSEWVSPYTYRALLAPSAEGGGIPGGCTLREARTEMLFLRMTIHRDGTVKVGESFHHEAVLQGGIPCAERFSIEFWDKKKNVLDCAQVSCVCEQCGGRCWPKSIRQAVRFPRESRWLVVWDGDRKIHEEPIRDAPRVEITGTNKKDDGVLVTWKSDPEKCWYLVHWFDEKAGVWRGVAPRQQDTSLLVPIRLFSHSARLKIRILATEKISTGYAEGELTLRDYTPPEPTLNIVGFDFRVKQSQSVSEVLRAVALDSAGRQLPADRIFWYTEEGSELSRGDSVDLRQLPPGQHVIRAVVRFAGERSTAKSWLVERTSTGIIVHHPMGSGA